MNNKPIDIYSTFCKSICNLQRHPTNPQTHSGFFEELYENSFTYEQILNYFVRSKINRDLVYKASQWMHISGNFRNISIFYYTGMNTNEMKLI